MNTKKPAVLLWLYQRQWKRWQSSYMQAARPIYETTTSARIDDVKPTCGTLQHLHPARSTMQPPQPLCRQHSWVQTDRRCARSVKRSTVIESRACAIDSRLSKHRFTRLVVHVWVGRGVGRRRQRMSRPAARCCMIKGRSRLDAVQHASCSPRPLLYSETCRCGWRVFEIEHQLM